MMNLKPILLLLIPVLFPFSGSAQITGCTDPQALNYNSEANTNDGTCLYPATSITPVIVSRSLPTEITETSGVIYWNGGLWTHNDSGNEPMLYKIDTLNGRILQNISVTGAENTDWEDIAQDDEHIYIGDFGNNFGNRTDLKVYVLEKSSFPPAGNGSVPSETISFSYGDQPLFEIANRNNDYDCESMIAFGDSLFLFTKNWLNEQTRLYGMPGVPGTYVLLPLGSMDSDGLVTGADVIAGGSEVILCGYENYKPFIWLLFDFQGNGFFNGNKRRIDFSGMLGTQTEGTSYTFGRNVYISSEKTTIVPARLFRLNTTPWTVNVPIGNEGNMEPVREMKLYPNPNDGNFHLDFGFNCKSDNYMATIINSYGAMVMKDCPVKLSECTARFSVPELMVGLYLLKVSSSEGIMTERLLVR
ncbi:MAG: T9SS type A sorting domain-containing protein [Bacteroidota bacterium]